MATDSLMPLNLIVIREPTQKTQNLFREPILKLCSLGSCSWYLRQLCKVIVSMSHGGAEVQGMQSGKEQE